MRKSNVLLQKVGWPFEIAFVFLNIHHVCLFITQTNEDAVQCSKYTWTSTIGDLIHEIKIGVNTTGQPVVAKVYKPEDAGNPIHEIMILMLLAQCPFVISLEDYFLPKYFSGPLYIVTPYLQHVQPRNLDQGLKFFSQLLEVK